MSELVGIITSKDSEQRNRSLEQFARQATFSQLLSEAAALDRFRRRNENLYESVRALFFLFALHRFHLPTHPELRADGLIPFDGYELLLNRRFEEAISQFLDRQGVDGPNRALSSGLAAAYHGLAFQTLSNQVRRSVRSVRGNQWMFRTGHPADQPLRIAPLLTQPHKSGLFPILKESTPVRMDLTHSGWSDIFFLGMDYPEGARVINVSIDLSVEPDSGSAPPPRPPVEAYLRVIEEPVLRLASVDLGAVAEIESLSEIFDFARDYLGLLKAAVIASGLVPPGLEGAQQPLSHLMQRLVGPGRGIEIVSRVNDIPKGSRLAVSTSLLASLIAVCMRATGQTHSLTGGLSEEERRIVAARAILGEWLGGSGGGWQDSGGVWPGIKLIQGEIAQPGDPEYGVSRGRLLPSHHIFGDDEIPMTSRQALQDSLVLVHGGMAQDVGPILEMVTEKYLLRSEREWQARQQTMGILDDILEHLTLGDVRAIGAVTEANFQGPLQAIIPWAGNAYTDTLIAQIRSEFGDKFWGFWMLGGMSGGGMGFMFDPTVRYQGRRRLQRIMSETRKRMERAVPFAMHPVVYDFAINERGSWSELLTEEKSLMPTGYYLLTAPEQLRRNPNQLEPSTRAELEHFARASRTQPERSDAIGALFDRLLPRLVEEEDDAESLVDLLRRNGFDPLQHETIRGDLRSGRIGLAQNRLPSTVQIEDVEPEKLLHSEKSISSLHIERGRQAIAEGRVGVVTLAGGAGSRWTRGAGVVKAINPFVKIGDAHRTFLDFHLAKSRQSGRLHDRDPIHVITTSYLTHDAIESWLNQNVHPDSDLPVYLSPGHSIGLRMVPMARDLRFAWEETPRQLLDEQAEKVQESLHGALIGWAEQMGGGSDYTDNLPLQSIHPTGHWYEFPNLLRNGTLSKILEQRPQLEHLLMHNIDTAGVHLDPGILGLHMEAGNALSVEMIHRNLEDRGGGLAHIDGRLRLIEGLALPHESVEFRLRFYNSNSFWLDIDQVLTLFDLTRSDLSVQAKVDNAVRGVAARMPTYITLKDVKKRWGHGQEDIFPVTQFEKLWGDMTALPECSTSYIVVPRMRGQQLKEPAQLDGWLRDGSAAYAARLCDW